MIRTLALLCLAFAASGGLAGCVARGAGPGEGSSPSPSPSSPTYEVSTSPDDLLLRIDTGGGLVPASYLLTHLPELSLYGDGRIVVPGPVIEIYPAPLLPNMREMRVSPSEIQRILAAADAAGLLGPDAQFDAAGIADAPTTTFTTVVAGRRHIVSAYALFEGQSSGDAAVDARRTKLMRFRDLAMNLSKLLGRAVTDDEAYEAEGWRIYTSPAAAAEPDPQGLTRQVVTWPLAADPASSGVAAGVAGGRCLAVTGTDVTRFLAVARTANVLTIWTHGTGRYAVAARPLLPGETGCGSSPS